MSDHSVEESMDNRTEETRKNEQNIKAVNYFLIQCGVYIFIISFFVWCFH